MLVASSFDLWQKDTFFSAAEEVQESADIMESAYRAWVRSKRERLTPQVFDEISGELQAALGTAKWQLEEFERAVRLSYRNRADEITMARHSQFVNAIENQISRVEEALRESFNEEGKEQLRWVNLTEEECDDLALFLSGFPKISQTIKEERAKLGESTKGSNLEKQYMNKDLDGNSEVALIKDIPNQTKGGFKDVTSDVHDNYVIEVEVRDMPETRDDCQADRTINVRRSRNSTDIDALKIIIDGEDEQKKELIPCTEATPKEKGSKPVFWKRINQISRSQRQLRVTQHLQFSWSARFMLALMLTILFTVPFVLYLT